MERLTTFDAHAGQVLDLTFTPESDVLISAGMDNMVKLWSVDDWELIATLEGHEKSVNSLALSPEGRTLATGSSDATVGLWSLPNRELLHTLQNRKKTVSAVAISADGAWVASGWYGGRAVVWTTDGENVVDIEASGRNLSAVAAGEGRLATAGLGDEINVWEIPSGALVATLSGHETAVNSVHFVASGQRLVSLGYEGTIRLWDTGTWEQERVIDLDDASARRLALSTDEGMAALSLEGRIELWNAQTWHPVDELSLSAKAVGGMAFSPDGAHLAAGAADGKVRVWVAA